MTLSTLFTDAEADQIFEQRIQQMKGEVAGHQAVLFDLGERLDFATTAGLTADAVQFAREIVAAELRAELAETVMQKLIAAKGEMRPGNLPPLDSGKRLKNKANAAVTAAKALLAAQPAPVDPTA